MKEEGWIEFSSGGLERKISCKSLLDLESKGTTRQMVGTLKFYNAAEFLGVVSSLVNNEEITYRDANLSIKMHITKNDLDSLTVWVVR